MTESRSIHTKEAASLLRARLKHLYPTIRFSVRFERYSMGSHINVSWIDGPTQRTIAAIANAYSSNRFDGSNDSTFYVKSWLLADGSAVSATEDADGYRSGNLTAAPDATAELVTFYGSAPHCSRTISATYEAACSKAWAGLSSGEKAVLTLHDRFPVWEGYSDGYKLAAFFDADKILGT
jgi:hypothetical protein